MLMCVLTELSSYNPEKCPRLCLAVEQNFFCIVEFTRDLKGSIIAGTQERTNWNLYSINFTLIELHESGPLPLVIGLLFWAPEAELPAGLFLLAFSSLVLTPAYP